MTRVPSSIPALLMVVYAFAEFPLPGIGVGSGTMTVALLIVLLLGRYRYINTDRRVVLISLAIVGSIPISFFGGWALTGSPWQGYFLISTKSLWGLLVLLIPPTEIAFRPVVKYMSMATLFGLLAIGSFSIPYYLETGESLGRYLYVVAREGPRLYGRPRTPVPFAMDIHNSMLQSILAVNLPGYAMILFQEGKRSWSAAYVSAVVIVMIVLFVNEYLLAILVFIFLCFWMILSVILGNPARIPVKILSFAGMLCLFGFLICLPFAPLFADLISARFGLDGTTLPGGLRYIRIARGGQTFIEHFWIGTGYPTTQYLSAHSTILDRFTIFGFFLGLFGNFPFLIVGAGILWVRGFRRADDFPRRYVYSATFIGVLIQGTFNTFGSDHKAHLGFGIMLLLIMLNELKREEVTEHVAMRKGLHGGSS
jgi:hypothetical protein